MTAWQEYLATAQRLDTLRRAAAELTAEQAAAARAAHNELATLRASLAHQQTRLQEAARQAGTQPVLAPGPPELAAAQAAILGTAPAQVRAHLQMARRAIASADTVLSGTADATAPGSSGPHGLRNALVYAGYAGAAALLQIVLFFAVGGGVDGARLGLLCCGLVVPVFTFGLGWLTVGAFAPPPGATRHSRSPVLGAVVSLLALTPHVLLLVWIVLERVSA